MRILRILASLESGADSLVAVPGIFGVLPGGEWLQVEGGEVGRLVLDLDVEGAWCMRRIALVHAAVVGEGRSHRVAAPASAPRR